MKIKLRFRGFTIMEMLVVIAIVGLLATIIAVTYIGARAHARDTQRFDDVSTIIKAVDSYIAYNNIIPGEGDVIGAHLSEDCDSDIKNDLKNAGLLNKIPTDPLAINTCDINVLKNSASQEEDQYYFYGWDPQHPCSVGASRVKDCLSINRIETNKLRDDLLTRFTKMNMATCGVNVNIGTGDDFDYCFTYNQ